MTSYDNVSGQPGAPASPLIVVVGGGPKAAALAAKARVLRELGIGEARVVVIERHKVAANWRGGLFGFTDGEDELCTPPEKDVGFPYKSDYGDTVDIGMLKYTWRAHLLRENTYSDWVDLGRPQPKLAAWARYVEWALELADPYDIRRETTVTNVEPSGEKLLVHMKRRRTTDTLPADGVVFTGPGEPMRIGDSPSEPERGVFDGKNYWIHIHTFKDMTGKVALIGGGGTAASIARSLLQIAPALGIDIINPRGSIFTRGESVREKRLFCHPEEWLRMDEDKRLEFIKRTDRGVFSVAAQRLFDKAEKLEIITGTVSELEHTSDDKIVVHFERGDPPKKLHDTYDRVIVALGFDPFSSLELIPERFRPKYGNPDERLEVQRQVDKYLRLPLVPASELEGREYNVHVPMLAGLAQGPGFPNLTCLGRLSDRILSRYIETPKPPRRSETKK